MDAGERGRASEGQGGDAQIPGKARGRAAPAEQGSGEDAGPFFSSYTSILGDI